MTYPTAITGYGRKRGLDAGLNSAGWMPSGTISARTMNPSNGESQGGNNMGRGNYWGVNRINNVSGSGSPQIWDENYPRT